MGIDLGFTKLADMDPSVDIPASLHPNMEITNIVIASGQNLTRGTCLGKETATGKYYIWDNTVVDGTENLVGILGCNVDATDSDGKGFMYVHGEFLKSALTAAQEISTGVYNNGSIVIKEEQA